MKKYLQPKFLPVIITITGLLGFLLRLWSIGKGPDAAGLYAPALVPWILLWIVTAAVPVVIILMTRPLSQPVKYTQNFPASIVPAIGSLIASVGIAISGAKLITGDSGAFVFIVGILGLTAAVMMVLVAYARLKGRKPNFFCHAIVCLYFALQTFDQCRTWSNYPQIGVFLFAFLAQICMMLATYQLCAFDVDLGKRRVSLFWSLSGVYCCLVALPSSENILFYGAIAIWLLTNLCSLTPAKKRKPVQEPENPVQAHLSGSDVSMDEIMSWLEEE